MSEWIEITPRPGDDGSEPRQWVNVAQVVTIDGDENMAFIRDANGKGYLLKDYRVVMHNGNPKVVPKRSAIDRVRFQ